ncbi:ABC transporter ATP-binding protein [Arthrobacter sp. CAL618]|uniref:ABC transporter ATP-binding protein n=1 Tax=Arthrobacter sp. CAL618 TaxID=1055770 RepID=UPI001ED9B0BA|nr:ABC transporter ATP-binding protein [Arthrobacter sp. CAL618]
MHALKNVSLVVGRGEAVGIIGRNGSGKSTLMKLINGRVPPSSGAIYASSRPTLLGVSAALVPDISGEQNIMLGCLAMGMSKRDIADKYQSIVDLSGLEGSIHLPLRTYSSGMASRLQFAIATAINPEILLIDEALNTGDDQFRGRTKQRMDELLGNAGCVFLVSHSLETISEMCSRVIWLDEGELVMDGQPSEVIKWYRIFAKHLAARDRFSAMKTKRRVLNSLVVPEVVVRETGRRSSE